MEDSALIAREVVDLVRGVSYQNGWALSRQEGIQPDLFGVVASVQHWEPIYAAEDVLDCRLGKHTANPGLTFKALNAHAHQNKRGDIRREE